MSRIPEWALNGGKTRVTTKVMTKMFNEYCHAVMPKAMKPPHLNIEIILDKDMPGFTHLPIVKVKVPRKRSAFDVRRFQPRFEVIEMRRGTITVREGGEDIPADSTYDRRKK
jgi:hypothetical protein